MSRKTIFYIVFFSVLVIAFFVVLSYAIPGFTNPKVRPISSVKPFSFTTQDGKQFTEKDLEGKVAVIEYFFTTCKGICPRMNNNLRVVYDQFKNEPDFLIVSHTSDPEVDTPEKLKRYADSMQVDINKWIFLTGRKDSLYDMARFSYKIDDPANNLQSAEDDFLHTQFMALVNKDAEVVKIYDGLKPSEMKQLSSETRKLLKN
jgi:protein SCO1/2